MLLGIHTIAWGESVDLDEMLFQIKSAGYQGAELFQHPDMFSGGNETVIDAFRDHGIQLIGTCAGSFREKMELVRDYCRKLAIRISDSQAPYIYIDDWDPKLAEQALDEGFRLALHPHMYMAVQTLKEVDFYLVKYPRLLFLPDTAHLTIAGEDSPDSQGRSIALVTAIRDRWKRLAAVHLKDWSAEVGRSYQFYAAGFCSFGKGDVKLKEVLELLWSKQFQGWIVVEQDRTGDPFQLAIQSRKWILEQLPPQYQVHFPQVSHA